MGSVPFPKGLSRGFKSGVLVAMPFSQIDLTCSRFEEYKFLIPRFF